MLPETLCQTQQFSCMGCCGRDYGTESQVRRGVQVNTEDFKETKDMEAYRKRAEKLRACGVCRGVIHKTVRGKERVLCGLHPLQNNGSDFRDRFCNKNFFCTTMKQWVNWSDTRKKQFLAHVAKQKPDWYEYSMKMDEGTYLKEFVE